MSKPTCTHLWKFTADDDRAVTKTCLLCGDREIVRVLSQTAWTIEKPAAPGWYWYRKGPTNTPEIIYSGVNWDAIVDFAGQAEPVTIERDHLLTGEWAGPLEPPA